MQTEKQKNQEFLHKIVEKKNAESQFSCQNDKKLSLVDIFLYLYLQCVDFYVIFLVSKTNVFTRKTGGLPYERGQKLLYRR